MDMNRNTQFNQRFQMPLTRKMRKNDHPALCQCCEVMKRRRALNRIHQRRHQLKYNKTDQSVVTPVDDVPPKMIKYKPSAGHQIVCECCQTLMKKYKIIN